MKNNHKEPIGKAYIEVAIISSIIFLILLIIFCIVN